MLRFWIPLLAMIWSGDFARAKGGDQAALSSPRAYVPSVLPSGLEVVATESHKVPLVTIVLAVKAGSMTETPDIRGLTHLWEHMFFKGNARIPNQEAFNRRIRQLGIVYNGDTSAELVRYYFTLPSIFLDEGLQFMADAIMTPLLDETELTKEREVVMDEYDRAAANPDFDAANLARALFYGSLEYRRDPLGLRPIIQKAPRAELLRIKNEVFVPGNSALVIAGDFDSKELTERVSKHFGSWVNPPGWQPTHKPTFAPLQKSYSYVMIRPNVDNPRVSLTYAGPRARIDRDASFAVDVLSHLLAQKSGRFYRKFVDSGLTYHAGLSYYTQSQSGEIDLSAVTSAQNAKVVAERLHEEIKEWAKPGYFTETQLEDVRRRLMIDHQREVNQTSEFAKNMAFWWGVTGLDYYDQYLTSLRRVTLRDVRSFVRQWLMEKPHLTATLVSPDDASKASLKDTAAPLVEEHLSMYSTLPSVRP